jgi:hypothetical protein
MTKKKVSAETNKYGPLLMSGRAEEYAMETFEVSRREKAEGRKGIPICSWGPAGIGKTELPNLLVKKYTDFFDGNIVYLPMAQIEEKAELQGLPELQTTKRLLITENYPIVPATEAKLKKAKPGEIVTEVIPGKDPKKYIIDKKSPAVPTSEFKTIKKPLNNFIQYDHHYVIEGTLEDGTSSLYLCIPEILDGSQMIVEEVIDGNFTKHVVDARTIYATPSWIPQESTHGKKGLLVIDDMNRADGRIINSIMQLLQDGALLGWRLPEKWEIYCTCNPDNADYAVTPFDGAQMTRMANFEQKFDKNSWLEDWAIPTGVHPIAQNFVMTNPEVVTQGERTNPRSFDKFFRMIHTTLDKVKVTGDKMEINSTGEGGILAKKINDYGLMNVEEIPLQTFMSFLTCGYGKLPGIDEILKKNFDLDKFFNQITEGNNIRTDILATINTRLVLHVSANKDELVNDKEALACIKKWILAKKIPADLRYGVVDKVLCDIPDIADEELAEIIFSRLTRR